MSIRRSIDELLVGDKHRKDSDLETHDPRREWIPEGTLPSSLMITVGLRVTGTGTCADDARDGLDFGGR